jgi:hypothetical protein
MTKVRVAVVWSDTMSLSGLLRFVRPVSRVTVRTISSTPHRFWTSTTVTLFVESSGYVHTQVAQFLTLAKQGPEAISVVVRKAQGHAAVAPGVDAGTCSS